MKALGVSIAPSRSKPVKFLAVWSKSGVERQQSSRTTSLSLTINSITHMYFTTGPMAAGSPAAAPLEGAGADLPPGIGQQDEDTSSKREQAARTPASAYR